MAVNRNGHILGHGIVHLLDLADVQHGAVTFHGVGQVQGSCTGFHHSLQNFNHEVHVFQAVAKMFATEFHVTLVAHQGLGKLHAIYSAGLHLVRSHMEHMFHGERACSQEGMDTGVRSILDGFPAALNVAGDATSQTGDHHLLGNFVACGSHFGSKLSQFLYRFKIHFRRSGETHFGTLHTQLQQLEVNILLLGIVPGLGQSLVSVTQSDVIKERFSCLVGTIHHTFHLSYLLPASICRKYQILRIKNKKLTIKRDPRHIRSGPFYWLKSLIDSR